MTCMQESPFCHKNNPVLTDQIGEGNRSVWQLIRKEPGYYLRSAALESDAALQYYGRTITAYTMRDQDRFLFNFYELR